LKIGILTYHFSNNYGALFQAYGLKNFLTELGHDVNFVNYHPDHIETGGDLNINNIFKKSGLKVIYLKLTSLKEKYFGNKNIKEGFYNFRKDFLGIKGKEYKTLLDIEKAKLEYDILICGSDQIWNPSEHFGVDPVYFLDFNTISKKIIKISYAPSFGKSNLDEKYYAQLKKLVNRLDYISVREKSGVDILKQLTKKDISLVPDPTVLISDYKKIMKKYDDIADDYIFCYYLRSRENIGEVSEYIAQQFKYKIYSPHNSHRRWKEIGETVYPCPRQWLDLLFNSKIVITNSFHGTMLSILLNKPFIVVGIAGEKAKYNERVQNLLSQCGLEHRLINEFNKTKINQLKKTEINWAEVNEKISDMKKSGETFLTESLKGFINE
jgi:hypothetical protein